MSAAYGYLYDADGTRVAKGSITPVSNPATQSLSCDATTNGFQFTENYVLGPSGEELTMFGVASGTTTWQRTNVYAAGKLLATYDTNGLHFHLEDPLGTRRLQLSGTLATLGCLETDVQSLPFGDQLNPYTDPNACPTADDATPLHFTGKERDSESGNDYFGARYYASSMGRWLSPDPGWFIFANILDPQSLNLYSHALNNPLVWIDSDGLELVRAVLANGQTVVVDRSVAPELISMVREASNAGLMVTVSSGFRSYSKQAELYSRWKNGQSKYPAAPPGRSAHNGGLAVDFRPNLNANQMNTLAQLGHQNGLNYAGQKDGVHFGPYYSWEINWDIVHENMNSQPDSTIVDGGVTTVVVTDTATTVDVDNSTIIPDQITPVDTQNLDLTPQPITPPPLPPQDQQPNQN
jgi:RHS repeat-associated protein